MEIGYDHIVEIDSSHARHVAPAAAAFLADAPAPYFLSVGFFETHRDYFEPTSVRDALYSLPPAHLPDTPETRRDIAAYKASARSLDQGVELTQGTTSYIWGGGRIVRGWAIELLLASLLIPFFVSAVDLFAHCRRRRIPLGPAFRALRNCSSRCSASISTLTIGWSGPASGPTRPPRRNTLFRANSARSECATS